MPLLQGTSGSGDAAWTNALTSDITTTRGVAGGTALAIGGRAFAAIAASANVTNTTTETPFSTGTYTIPAGTFAAGNQLRFRAWGTTPSTNSTDTLIIRARIGATGITGAIVCQTAAIDVANADIFTLDGVVSIRTAGTGGTMVGSTLYVLGVPDTATGRSDTMASTALNTTLARDLTLTAEWSVAAAANQASLDGFVVWVG